MQARHYQYAIAAVFFILGGWCLIAPAHMLDTVLLPQYRAAPDAGYDRLTLLLAACFGAQACLAGLFASFAKWTPVTFAVYGFALLPFFVFNWWTTHYAPIFGSLGLIDLVGNAAMLAFCYLGWRAACKEMNRD